MSPVFDSGSGTTQEDEGPVCPGIAGGRCWVDKPSLGLFVSWIVLVAASCCCASVFCASVLCADPDERVTEPCPLSRNSCMVYGWGYGCIALLGSAFVGCVVSWRVLLSVGEAEIGSGFDTGANPPAPNAPPPPGGVSPGGVSWRPVAIIVIVLGGTVSVAIPAFVDIYRKRPRNRRPDLGDNELPALQLSTS